MCSNICSTLPLCNLLLVMVISFEVNFEILKVSIEYSIRQLNESVLTPLLHTNLYYVAGTLYL